MLDIACCVSLFFLKSNSCFHCEMQRILVPCCSPSSCAWTHTVSLNLGFLRLISKPFVFWYAFLCAFCLTTVTQPYFPFYALFSDRFQFSFEGLPKPGICIRVNANETGPRIAFPQGNGVCFAVRLFWNATKHDAIPIQSRRTACILLFALRFVLTHGFKLLLRTTSSELLPNHITVWEKT